MEGKAEDMAVARAHNPSKLVNKMFVLKFSICVTELKQFYLVTYQADRGVELCFCNLL